MLGQAKRRATKIRPKVVGNSISGANVGQVGMDVLAKFGDSSLNRSRDTRLPHFVTNNSDDDAGRRTL